MEEAAQWKRFQFAGALVGRLGWLVRTAGCAAEGLRAGPGKGVYKR